MDPRLFQIVALASFLSIGVGLRDFSLQPLQAVLAFVAAAGTQRFLDGWTGKPRSGLRSALITGFGLSLLLRADALWVHPLAASLAIASKFLLRIRGKHLFNPANFGVILSLLFFPGTWVSPGQWGHDVAVAGWLVAFGMLVTTRARSGNASWIFLATYLGALAVRNAWLGYEWAVWLHQLSDGTLLLFTFFMISDPMTIPNARCGRFVHAVVVATIAFAWRFGFYGQDGLLWALFLVTPLVPVLDALFPAPKFEWTAQAPTGGSHVRETVSGDGHSPSRHVVPRPA